MSFAGMESLDDIELLVVFARRAVVMRTVPAFLKGAFRGALRLAMDEAISGNEALVEPRQDRAWKLFLCKGDCLVAVVQRRLGLRSAVRLRFAAHWGSWADCLHMVKARHPTISGMMVRALATADRSPTIQAVLS